VSDHALNLAWVLVCAFLVMFMQLGFAMVETGFSRTKNAVHTMAMNLVIYPVGVVGFWLTGYAIAFGGVPGWASLGPSSADHVEVGVHLGTKLLGLFGASKFALSNVADDPPGLAMFLFSAVFMDTAATIPTGALAERWKFSAFIVYGFFMSAFLYPLFANWVWGGGWLSSLGANFGLGHGVVDFAGSSVVHMTGGVAALAGSVVVGSIVSCMGTLAKVVSDLKKAHPGLNVRLLSGKATELAGKVEDGELDAAFLVEAGRRTASTRWTHLYEEPLVVIAPRSVPGNDVRKVLAGNPFLRFDRTQRTGLQIDRVLRRLGVPLDEFLELNAIETLVELVRQGAGVTLLPLLHGANWETTPSLRVLRLPTDLGPAGRSVGMIERREHARQAITAAICEQCATALRERAKPAPASLLPRARAKRRQ